MSSGLQNDQTLKKHFGNSVEVNCKASIIFLLFSLSPNH